MGDTEFQKAADKLAKKNRETIKAVVEIIDRSKIKALIENNPNALDLNHNLGLMVERELRKKMGDQDIYVAIAEVLEKLKPIVEEELAAAELAASYLAAGQ